MNRSRQEFSSRGNKSFNSNGGAKAWKQQQQGLKSGGEKKKTDGGFGGKNRSKSGDKLQNGFPEEERKGKKVVEKGFGKKELPVVNGTHKVVSGKKGAGIEPVGKPEKIAQKSPKLVNGNSVLGKVKKEQKATPDTGQKRKSVDNCVGSSKKSKKVKKAVASESDSDAEDYMDKFFEDCLDDDEPEEPLEPSGEEESDSELSESESDEEQDDGNAMTIEELLDFFGNNRDRNGSAASAGRPQKKAKKTEKKAANSSGVNGGWLEEDNDVELEYKDSDGEQEQAPAAQCQALVPAGGDDELLTSEDDYDYSPGDSGEEEIEEEEDTDDMLSFELGQDYSDDDGLEEEEEENSFGSEYSDVDNSSSDSSKDDHEFSSDFDSDEEDGSEEEDEDDYWDDTGSYDSDEDTDYMPQDDDDLFIGRGEAVIYEIDDNSVSFNDEIESAQIVELPSGSEEGGRRGSVTTGTESQTEGEECGEEEIPELVPIYDSRGRMIDSAKMLERELRKSKKSPKKSATVVHQLEPQQPPTLITPSTTVKPTENPEPMEQTPSDVPSTLTARNLHELDAEMDTTIEPDSTVVTLLPPSKRSAYRMYDSIDMRMSLLVLQEPLFFSGHLTIQPLIGQLEVMGYRLKRGECRNVFAARGFQSLNLSPVKDGGAGFSRELMAGVLTRLDRHFQEVDLRELEERFDPGVAVLVLLQADCNNRRISVVDKYLPEEVLFPRVELLRREGSFFTSEHLLNCEFFVEQQQEKMVTACFRADPAWDRIEVKGNSRVVVMGGKGAGKSTLCQYLVNRHVGTFKKVLLIDLDIGQPIQHIPETISVTVVSKPLLGVASFDPIAPARSWLFGSLDVVSSPIFYVQNVRQLVQYCRDHKADWANIPWIINTMGYVTGFGEELMAAVLRMLAPTDVIQLNATSPSLPIPNFKNTLNSDFINRYSFNILQAEVAQFCQKKTFFRHHALPVSFSRKGFTLNAPKRRYVALLTHLARILNDSSSEWFNEVRPFRAPLTQLQVLITREDDQSLPEHALPAVLNATLVYLCRRSAQAGLYECLGIGIVRGVDKQGNVYLLHSLPGEELADVTVLAICSSSLPNAAFLRQSARVQGAIPYVYNVE
ncbi:polynucleotide 5'-hydroxyl-kinase NOL9 [Culex pipiens pallens]|uniref:polynucleotide 5'-hydroxyl-kinase NOL9 n=1 Tax=Culex pipiens pallens TaxID=42434 RepID=UPI001953CC4C|nr:polynucleotide 5'-hydroxyl-kinase NOL9 [Culex pipiens pallens]